MTTTEAVEVHTDAKPAPLTPQVAIKRLLDQYRPVISKLLVGTGVTEETFVAQIANACRATPDLFIVCEKEGCACSRWISSIPRWIKC